MADFTRRVLGVDRVALAGQTSLTLARRTSGGPNFAYDGAGRLTDAWVPGHRLTYGFTPSGGCGELTTAGKNTNRTSVTDNGGPATTYCYDHADRLTSTTDARYGGITYDAHGNTRTMGNQALVYDGADRHVETKAGATTVRYVRDATDRIVERKVNGTTVARYGYSGDGDTPDFTMDRAGTVVERSVGLLGGAMQALDGDVARRRRRPPTGKGLWAYFGPPACAGGRSEQLD